MAHTSMSVDKKELYIALPPQFVAGWLMDSKEFYDLYVEDLMLAPVRASDLTPSRNIN